MHNFKELIIWNKSMDVYQETKKFPEEEKFNLVSQMRRSAVSIPSNSAEGAGRNSDKEFNQFLGIAKGSSFELQTQLIISNKLKLIPNERYEQLNSTIEEVQKMISGFQSKLKSNV